MSFDLLAWVIFIASDINLPSFHITALSPFLKHQKYYSLPYTQIALYGKEKFV
jgi:hypothetical protein